MFHGRIPVMNNSPRCLYESDIITFINKNSTEVLGEINKRYHGEVPTTSREAWEQEIIILKKELKPWENDDGKIIFEYDIPRLGKRIDVVLLLRGIIFCLEFKVGEKDKKESDIDQVLDYALDLKNFHKYSEDRVIAPILISTEYKGYTTLLKGSCYKDKIISPLVTGKKRIGQLISDVIEEFKHETPINKNWLISPYYPTPTIIEAARKLYECHTVEDITRHEADSVNTDKTIKYILDVIQKSKNNNEKSICFVTGVPGAGKTLVGLDIAVKQTYQNSEFPNFEEQAVYLSGNGPLVAVLTEALALDNIKRCKEKGEKKNKKDALREVSKFIQIIHRYRDNMLAKLKTPIENGILEIDPSKAVSQDKAGYGEVEHVAIFDEAQRSWTHEHLAAYLKRGGTYGNKLKVDNFPMSESSFLIWSLDQRKDWATIVCLVGGGQEINTGEAGISEWIRALNEQFNHWKIYISPKLTDKEYAEGKVEELLKDNKNVTYSEDLHLSVSLRSFRAEKLSAFVHYLLAIDNNAIDVFKEIKDKYPIVLTRDMEKAKKWLREKVRGNEKTGVLITKESARYKPLGIHVLDKDEDNSVHWFLDDKSSIKSSNYLEDAATEIQVQGLELDYTCLLWDADMRYVEGEWKYYRFKPQYTKWTELKNEKNAEDMKYMLNAYRVLLTRARKGMIICVPEGNGRKNQNGFWEDSTRLPEYYDGTYNYLRSLGLEEI